MNSKDIKSWIDNELYKMPAGTSVHPTRIARISKQGGVFRLFICDSAPSEVLEFFTPTGSEETTLINRVRPGDWKAFAEIHRGYKKVDLRFWLLDAKYNPHYLD